MSKTPRTNAAWNKHATDDKTGFNIALDMREMFREYVKAEDKWRDELNKANSDDLRIEAAKLRKQAKGVLGL